MCSTGHNRAEGGVGHDVRDPMLAEEASELQEPVPGDEQHGLPEIAHALLRHEPRIPVRPTIVREGVAEDEPPQAAAQGSVRAVDVPRHDIAGRRPLALLAGPADGGLAAAHVCSIEHNAAKLVGKQGRGPKVRYHRR